jgi:catecholate siderophore receptor
VIPAAGAAGEAVAPVERSDDLFNWQAGLIFKPTGNTSLYASYATSSTPPNSLLGEGREDNGVTGGRREPPIDVEDLKPQKTRSYEVGAKATLFDGRLSLGLAAFQTETDNARVLGPDNSVEFIGAQRIRGIELSINGEILPGWTVFGGYSHLDPEVTDGGYTALSVAAVGDQAATSVLVPSINTGRQVPQVAKDSATLWTNLDIGRFSVGVGAFYMSRVYGGYQDNRRAVQDAAGNVTIIPATKTLIRSAPGYIRVDARAGYRISDAISLSVNVQNVTDETYFNKVYTSHYAGIAPGRSAFATLEVGF